MRIEEGLVLFVRQLRADGRSPHTIGQYTRHIGLLAVTLREHMLGEITPDDLARFLTSPSVTHVQDGRAKKAASVNVLRSSVRTFFRYLHDAGHVQTNAARLVRRARCGSPPPRALSDQDQKRLFDVLGAATGALARRDHALFALMFGTGIRLSSALAVRAEDLDFDRGELRLRRMKGDREDMVFVPQRLAEHLRAFVAERGQGRLFVGRGGTGLSPRHVQRRLDLWAKAAELGRKARPHDARHSFACGLYRRTRDVLIVRAALNHRSIASTLVYARADTDAVRAAITG